ncbi:hypothetical protein [Actinokineospora bangkokensis]|uniref:Uncharacterized protein n=1 Tax=Actinokineospora bangkokensis TaxID=1193682 RepID=A0A1Q9LEV6_9PSEU|nr:hypothetical protein [Actinokineospora bangkokensis]OLR90553.1 hypothetical protein BJP25_28415 [Actinokineospora bangkokensis]
MNQRTPAPGPAAPAEPDRAPLTGAADRVGWADVPRRVRTAVGLAAGAGVLQALGYAVGPISGGPPPGFTALPLLVVLSLLPPAAAAAAFARGRPVLGAAVLVGAGALLPARFLLDLQFAVEPLYTSRPEVALFHSLDPVGTGAGTWLLLAGHLLGTAAAVLAFGRPRTDEATPYTAEFDDPTGDRPAARRGGSLAAVLVLAPFAGAGLFSAPYRSDNLFQLADDAGSAPTLPGLGLTLLMVTVPLVLLCSTPSAHRSIATGVPLGLLLGLAAVELPNTAAGLRSDGLHATWGPVVALAAVLLLLATAPLVAVAARVWQSVVGYWRTSAGAAMHGVAALLGLVAAVLSLVAAASEQVVVDAVAAGLVAGTAPPDGLRGPEVFVDDLFYPVAGLVFVLSLLLAAPRFAGAVRPAFTVALAAVPFAGAATIGAVLAEVDRTPVYAPGNGVWAAGFAVAAAAGAAVLAGLAGSAERYALDEDPPPRELRLGVAAPLAAGVLFALGAFGLPAVRAPGFAAPGLWSTVDFASAGLWAAVLSLLAAAATAAVARPARAAALLVGGALLAAVRSLEYPLTAARAAGSTPGPGTWLALATVVALLIAALVAGTAKGARR